MVHREADDDIQVSATTWLFNSTVDMLLCNVGCHAVIEVLEFECDDDRRTVAYRLA